MVMVAKTAIFPFPVTQLSVAVAITWLTIFEPTELDQVFSSTIAIPRFALRTSRGKIVRLTSCPTTSDAAMNDLTVAFCTHAYIFSKSHNGSAQLWNFLNYVKLS